MGLEGLEVSFTLEKREGRLVSQMFLLSLQMFLLRLQQPAWCPCPERGWAVPAAGGVSDLQHYCACCLGSSAPAGLRHARAHPAVLRICSSDHERVSKCSLC